MHTGRGRLLGLLVGLALGALILGACTNVGAEATSTGVASQVVADEGPSMSVGAPSGEEPAGVLAVEQGAPMSSGVPAVEPLLAPASLSAPVATSGAFGYSALTGSEPTGIWVTGQGRVTVKPDLAILNLGVEAREATVSAARASASDAMTRVITALKGQGIEDVDIRTRYFNIQPITLYQEKSQNGYRYSEPQIVGYVVANQVSVKVRDLDGVGPILDDAVAAGGDLIRVQGISFTVEDPVLYTAQAREAAVRDALAKAKQLASLTNVTVGKLMYISELGGTPAPLQYDVASARAEAAYAPDHVTSISGGEIEITASIQAVFAIP